MKEEKPGIVDRQLARLGDVLSDPERRKAACRRIPRILGRALALLFFGYVLFLGVFLPLVDRIGERNLTTAFALYLPAQIWLLPPFFLLVPSLIFNRKLAVCIVLACLFFVWGYMDWEPGPKKQDSRKAELTLLTFNRGQQGGSLQPFKNELKPDVIAMQEATKRGARYLESSEYLEFSHANDIGEFMLLSRFPITDSGLLTFQSGGARYSPAAWFVLDFDGVSVVVFNVHLPTPRESLKAFRRGAFLWGVLGIPGTALASKREFYQEFWDVQMDLARQLDEHMRTEHRPYLIAGDLNAPARGVNYRRFAKGREDAHEVSGSGFGYTFPGTTRNPLSLFGPWLRIDHLFAGPGWKSRECVTEKRRQSQHLAVAARFELNAP